MFKKLSEKRRVKVVEKVKMLLHASRDCLRNKGIDTSIRTFDSYDAYYSEAFGIMGCLAIFGYGTINQANNLPCVETNLKWWLDRLMDEVLKEENFGGSNECDYCLEHFGKDGAGRGRKS